MQVMFKTIASVLLIQNITIVYFTEVLLIEGHYISFFEIKCVMSRTELMWCLCLTVAMRHKLENEI